MAVAYSLLESGTDTTAASSYVTDSVISAEGNVLVFVYNTKSNPAIAPTSLTGGGTFTVRASRDYDTDAAPTGVISVWSADDFTSGAVTIDFNSVNQTGITWAIVDVTSVDDASNDGVVQAKTNFSDTATDATGSLTFDAYGATGNRPIAAVATHSAGGTDHVWETNWTELVEIESANPSGRFAVAWRDDTSDTTASVTLATTDRWCMVGVEMKATVVGGGLSIPVAIANYRWRRA